MVSIKHETPHTLPDPTGVPQPTVETQVVSEFPVNPAEGAVYFTPPMVGRKTEGWTELSIGEKEAQLDRRIDLYQGVGAAAGQHIEAMKVEHNTTKVEKEEAAQAAITDELTGLINRRGLIQQIKKAIAETANDPDPRIDLLFIDLDNFKDLNDTQGHKKGDELLRKIADKFQELFHVREGDIVARLGGDEFVVLLRTKRLGNSRRQERTEDEAIEGASLRAQDTVEQVATEMNSSVKASVGVVKHKPYENAEDFLDRGDKAMYKVKKKKGAAR